MAAADLELGYAGAKVYAGFADGRALRRHCSFAPTSPELVAVIDADKLGQLRTGAASAVAAKYLARAGATTLGVIGCGWQAEIAGRVHPRRRARRSSGSSPTAAPSRSCASSASGTTAEPGESHRDPARVRRRRHRHRLARSRCSAANGCRPGALVCAVGANDGRRRELDNVVLERASFVCCDSIEDARLESADLIEPIEAGVLDWLEVHELQEVVAGELPGRQADDDIVVFKSNGLAAWDVAVAAAVVERARLANADRVARGVDVLLAEHLHELGAIEETRLLLRREPVLHVAILRGSRRARGRGDAPA